LWKASNQPYCNILILLAGIYFVKSKYASLWCHTCRQERNSQKKKLRSMKMTLKQTSNKLQEKNTEKNPIKINIRKTVKRDSHSDKNERHKLA